MKDWAGFAGTWATAAAIAMATHAGGAGGLKWLGASLSAESAGDFRPVAQSQALRVRIEASSERAFAPTQSSATRSLGSEALPVAESESGPIEQVEQVEQNEHIEQMIGGDAPTRIAEPTDGGAEGIEQCTNLSALIPRALWLEFRDYAILPRTYKGAYARHDTGVIQLVRFEPVNAPEFEYADRMLSSILQRCMNDLRTLPSQGDFEVKFVIGDE